MFGLSTIMEKFFSLIPKRTKKYKDINNGWNKNPQEKYLLADFEMRIYMGLGVALWLIASIVLIFALFGFIQKDIGTGLGWLIIMLFCITNGFTLFSMSNKKEKEANIERLKYTEAKMNKTTTVKRMEEVERNIKKTIYEEIIKKNFKAYKENKKEILRMLNSLIYALEYATNEVTEIYKSNKMFDYNINEIFEVETFFEVDSYKESELIQINLENIMEELRDMVHLITTEDEDIDNFPTLKLKVDGLISAISSNNMNNETV